ncbi:MAG TPA: membrane dipeptidase [Acidobacteriaceae bacterium]
MSRGRIRPADTTRRAGWSHPRVPKSQPGELRACAYRGFRRLHALVRSQGLRIATDAGSLAAARTAGPTALVAAEGADFLEGDAAYLDPAYTLGRLRHLQLTHYRVNELGDIQTEAPIHGGLTPFGVEVVRRCQRMGIIVDVAHGTYDLVRQAVDVSTKPLVLSHTSLTSAPRPRTRMITSDHARLVAETGGVIGIWPPSNLFPSLEALADGIARMADVVGVAHVGVGSDMMGLVVPSILPSYENLPELVAFLLRRFSPAEVTGIVGGNYMRVAKECLL